MALPIQWVEGPRRSRILMSCILMSLHSVLHFQFQHFLVLHFQRTPVDFENFVRRSFRQQHSLMVKLVDNTFNGHIVVAGRSILYRVSQKSEPLNILQQQPKICSDLNKILHTHTTTSVTNITTQFHINPPSVVVKVRGARGAQGGGGGDILTP